MQVLSVNEYQEVAGADAPWGCSNSMTSSQYSSTANFWAGVGSVGAVFSSTGLGAGVAFAGGAMYAYNSYCSF
ncbi:hypothetical protein [Pseudoduganella buxea]|uniref:Bacteriocin n=1 Tax=Pseudoduganella buxea TaxID=1949069 RepID=A0A6I3T3Q7_9BURK|nr:hypothetical protein [Pseudoduganella buxea]MTV55112.1 hypothetical protein [Pseudoduganella buxea]GGC05782.1 hypothetical protein GCM10011572_29590 [Pseudoduganella buxea]